MAVVERIEVEDRDTWLRLRLDNVNASEVSICCGEGPYGSLAELFAQKKGLRPGLTDSGVLRRGRWAEPAVFEALAEQYPQWEVRRARIYLVDRERRIGATPDGFALRPDRPGRGVVQAKVISRGVFRRRWLVDEESSIEDGEAVVPIYYRLQTLTEMRLSECAWGIVAVIVASEFDMILRVFDIERDVELEALILGGVDTFWTEYFDRGIMPPFEPQRDAALIRALYPRDDGSVIDLTGNNRVGELVDQLAEVRAAAKRLKASETSAAAELQAMLGEHTFGQLQDGRAVAWKHQHRRAYAVEASDFRVLRILKSMPQQRGDEDEDE